MLEVQPKDDSGLIPTSFSKNDMCAHIGLCAQSETDHIVICFQAHWSLHTEVWIINLLHKKYADCLIYA